MLNVGKKAALAMGAYFGYKAIKGFGGEVVPAVTSGAMDIAFNDPEADRAVLGTDLTPSMMVMASGIPVASQIARAKNIDRTGINVGPVGSAATIAGIAGVSGFAGAKIGARMGKGLIGGVIGAAVGGALGTSMAVDNVIGTARKNSQIISQSPFYNQSLLTAERLNASGNIVFGMHNGRRG